MLDEEEVAEEVRPDCGFLLLLTLGYTLIWSALRRMHACALFGCFFISLMAGYYLEKLCKKLS